MPRYKMEGGGIVDTRNATASWRKDGLLGVTMEILHRSRKGRYYLERLTAVPGMLNNAVWIDRRTAAAWLLAQGLELPEDLAELEQEVSE